MYGGRGAGIVATVSGGVTTALVLPNTGSSVTIVGTAVSVFAGMVAWGATYSYLNR